MIHIRLKRGSLLVVEKYLWSFSYLLSHYVGGNGIDTVAGLGATRLKLRTLTYLSSVPHAARARASIWRTMTDGVPMKRSLSSRLAGMSFMKRGAERDLRETYAKRQKHREEDAHWTASPKVVGFAGAEDGPLVVVEGADIPDTLSLGRQSFGRFNSNLERRNEAIAAGLNPNTANTPAAAAAAPAPALHSNRAFMEPTLATPVDDPAPRVSPQPAPSARRVTGPRPTIAKKKGKRGVDETLLRKKRRHRKR